MAALAALGQRYMCVVHTVC